MDTANLPDGVYKGLTYIPGEVLQNNKENASRMVEQLIQSNEKNIKSARNTRDWIKALTLFNYVLITAFLALTIYFVLVKEALPFLSVSATIISILTALVWKPGAKLLQLDRRIEDSELLQAVLNETVALKDEKLKQEMLMKLLDKVRGTHAAG